MEQQLIQDIREHIEEASNILDEFQLVGPKEPAYIDLANALAAQGQSIEAAADALKDI